MSSKSIFPLSESVAKGVSDTALMHVLGLVLSLRIFKDGRLGTLQLTFRLIIFCCRMCLKASLHPATLQRCVCYVVAISLRNGLQSHFHVTDKFDASVDADTDASARCNRTDQNLCN